MSEFYSDIRVFRNVDSEVIRVVIGVIFRDVARNGCALGKNVCGVEAVVEATLSEEEAAKMAASAKTLKEVAEGGFARLEA